MPGAKVVQKFPISRMQAGPVRRIRSGKPGMIVLDQKPNTLGLDVKSKLKITNMLPLFFNH